MANLIKSSVIAYFITLFVMAYLITLFVNVYLITSVVISYLSTSFGIAIQIGTSMRRSSGRRSGGQLLAMT